MVFKDIVKMRFQGGGERGRGRRKKTEERKEYGREKGVLGLSLGSTTLEVLLEKKPK